MAVVVNPNMKERTDENDQGPAGLLPVYGGSLMAADYDVDAAHTTVQFKVGHLGFSELVGRFNTFSGTFSMDDANPAAAKASFEIDAASVDSNHEPRDKHLRSPDFLDVKQFPKMTFVSSGYRAPRIRAY